MRRLLFLIFLFCLSFVSCDTNTVKEMNAKEKTLETKEKNLNNREQELNILENKINENKKKVDLEQKRPVEVKTTKKYIYIVLSWESPNYSNEEFTNYRARKPWISTKSHAGKVNVNQKQNLKNDILNIPKISTITFKEYFQKSLIEGNIELMKFLVNNFSDGCLVNKDGNTPIHLSNNKQIVEIFINGGENVNSKNSLGLTPLQMNDNPEIIRFLIDKGADVNSTALMGTTALHIAILNGNFTVANMLISNGADIQIKTQDGLTPVALAIYKGDNKILNLFPIQNQFQAKVETLPDNFDEEIISLLTNQIIQGIEELVKRSLADDPFKNTRLEKMFVYGQFHNAVRLYKKNILEKSGVLQMNEVDLNSLIEATSIQVLKHCISLSAT